MAVTHTSLAQQSLARVPVWRGPWGAVMPLKHRGCDWTEKSQSLRLFISGSGPVTEKSLA